MNENNGPSPHKNACTVLRNNQINLGGENFSRTTGLGPSKLSKSGVTKMVRGMF